MSESVFDYDCGKLKRVYDRARGYKFESIWRCSTDGATFETRKSEATSEISRRIKMFMGEHLLDKIQYISVVMDCGVLLEIVGDCQIALHCYVQCATQIFRSSLQDKFRLEAEWEPISGGLFTCEEFRDENVHWPWEKFVIHGEVLHSNAQKIM